MNLTTIIPVHQFDDKIEILLTAALDSVLKQDKIGDDRPPVLVVYAAALDNNETFKTYLNSKAIKGLDVTYIKNEGKTDFQSQINFGVEKVETDWFSILEFDDELSTTYYKNVLHHIEKMDNVDLFLPILVSPLPKL